MNILSLFNGCGMLRPALDKVGIEVENYYSSEIDKYASEIAKEMAKFGEPVARNEMKCLKCKQSLKDKPYSGAYHNACRYGG